MHAFVNLPLSHVESLDSGLFSLFLSRGLRPELGLDAQVLDRRDPAWFAALRDRLDNAGLACSVHLPFFHLHPGAPDPLIREATLARLSKAFDIARLLRPEHMVGHGACCPDFPDQWLDLSRESWTLLLDSWPEHPPLHLENTFELEPDPLAALVHALGRERVGLCLDVGHWHCFARGSLRGNLDRWVETLAPALTHLHLHDNDGSGDQHLGLGRGTIPFGQLLALLDTHGLSPSATLEPHSEQDFLDTLAALDKDPSLARLLGPDS